MKYPIVANVLISAGVALAAPIVMPAVRKRFRPMAKAIIKGGLFVSEKVHDVTAKVRAKVRDVIAEAKGKINELVAEAKSEYESSRTEEQPSKAAKTRRRAKG